ncbi:SDR family NAD(P)-dependent oxidoreductase [Halobacillus naozhouensis]|uniref:SDR family NAD(P)-dependent oxidoreductase n=1 Tax=Halobacillus naozhouensis TaxID=554880 RepID=A0ABY8J2V2_9BACI|nr:SDR family oxidoreductase [Halobacillus naozhouensis]WFT75912.1 SDR family NAD(P)-dependent oxidoreductase [Halobacillus naozhouensis]
MKNVLITGAGTGLGRALAHQYAHNGYHVYLSGRTERKLLIVKNEISKAGGSAEVLICDVTEPASVSEAIKQLSHLDVLINNAGLGIFKNVESYDEEDITKMFNTNVKGTILMTKEATELLRVSNGRVLNIISTAGLRGKTNESVYCASKFAVRGFTECLHQEWQHEEMAATAVYMGGMNTPFWHESTHVSNPEILKGPEGVAEQIFQEDDGREEIIIDK